MVPKPNQARDKNHPATELHDFLEAFRPDVGKSVGPNPHPVGAGTSGLHDHWAVSRPDSRSARDWRQEWQAQHRPALQQPQNPKVLWLSLALVIAVLLSVYGVWRIDQAVHEHAIPSEMTADHTAPAIHWRGQ